MNTITILAAAQGAGPLVPGFVFSILLLLIFLIVLVCGVWAIRSTR